MSAEAQTHVTAPKPKVAIYKMSSCAGCQLEFLNLEPVLLALLGLVDLSYFVMARRET